MIRKRRILIGGGKFESDAERLAVAVRSLGHECQTMRDVIAPGMEEALDAIRLESGVTDRPSDWSPSQCSRMMRQPSATMHHERCCLRTALFDTWVIILPATHEVMGFMLGTVKADAELFYCSTDARLQWCGLWADGLAYGAAQLGTLLGPATPQILAYGADALNKVGHGQGDS